MSVDLDHQPTTAQDEYTQYRALSMAAVVTLVFGIVSLAGLVFPVLLWIPLVGIGFGVVALRRLSRQRDELTGRRAALTGLVLSVLCFGGGVAIATTIYVTEVPKDYERIGFFELQPDKRRPNLPVSQRALDLNGKKVFIKGYIYPDDRSSDLKKFVLVPDMGTCCFGGQPKLTDMMEVTLTDPLRTRFSFRRRKLAGILRVNTELKEISGLTGVYYQLEADYIR